jgi:hypothetical protein
MSRPLLLENVAEKIELNFVGYHVEGVAVMNKWGGGIGCIKMNPFDIDATALGETDLSDEEELNEIIKSLINDGGFGCQSIMGAYIVLYAYYSNKDVCTSGIKIHLKNYYLNKDTIKTPQRCIDLAEDTWYEVM